MANISYTLGAAGKRPTPICSISSKALGRALKEQLTSAIIFGSSWNRYITEVAAHHRRREERAIRRLSLLGLPANVDDETLAKRMGHHEMVPEVFAQFMGLC